MGVGEFSANARINLIGEHIDYNGGPVLPTALPVRTQVRVVTRADRQVHVSSREVESYELGQEKPVGRWIDYFQGVTARAGLRGLKLTGLDVFVGSDIPQGAGVSSSAALLIAMIRACDGALGWNLAHSDTIRLAVEVENEFVGAKVGVMDPLACLLAREGSALLVNTRDLTTQSIALPDGIGFGVINSGVKHSLAHGGGYNQRRAECESAAQRLGLRWLSDATPELLDRLQGAERLRARHVVQETERVHQFVAALRKRDLSEMGRLLNASHASLAGDYAVSTPEVDRLVAVLQSTPGVYGARMVGGGFGGCVIFLAKKGDLVEVAQRAFAFVRSFLPGAALLYPPAS